MFQNSGQSCNAPTRMLVPAAQLAAVEALAKQVAEKVVVGDPSPEKQVGPVVSKIQFDRVEGYIQRASPRAQSLSSAARGAPGLAPGYYVKPTIFSNVRNDMVIAREEIFGPVLCILPYQNEEEAVRIANDTPYGLAAYVWSRTTLRAPRAWAPHPRGPGRLNGARRHEHAVRRLQDVRQRPRMGRVRLARLPGGQGDDRSRRCLRPPGFGPGSLMADPGSEA